MYLSNEHNATYNTVNFNTKKPVTFGSLFQFEVLVSFAITIGFLLNFCRKIGGHLEASEGFGIDPYAFFMLAMTVMSILVLLIYGSIVNHDNMFLWVAIIYVVCAFFLTAISGMYVFQQLPFRFVSMFYWVSVMLLAYYSVLHLGTLKFHLAIVSIFLPIMTYFYFGMRSSAYVYSEFLLLNPVYFISYLLPVVLLLRNILLRSVFAFLIFVIVILSYKRMAFFAYSTSIIVYIYYISKTGSHGYLARYLGLFVMSIFAAGFFLFSFKYLIAVFGLDWTTRIQEMTQGGGSGRVQIWTDILSALSSQPFHYWLIGHGYLATAPFGGGHNEFIEVLYDFGVIGLTLYISFVIKLFRIFFEMKSYKYRYYPSYAVSLVWFAWGALFSQLSIHPYWFLGLALFWGITIADFHSAKIYSDPDRLGVLRP